MTSGQNYYDQIMQLVTLDERGSNMLTLQQAAIALGYQAQGWRLALPDLSGTGPLFAHVVIGGEHHFTVVLSVEEHLAYLADPTLGYMAMPLEEFALAFSGAVLKVSPADKPAQPAGDAATVGKEISAEAIALETVAVPLAEADVTPEAGEVIVEAPVTAQDPVADEPLTSQPAAEPVEDALPGQPVAEVLAAEALDEQSIIQPVAEPLEDALPIQEADVPVTAEAPAGYHGHETTDTNSIAEETTRTLTAAVTVLDEAEMENIFGRGKGNRGVPTRNRQPASDPVNRQTARGGGGGTTITWQRAGTTAGVGTVGGTTLGMAGKWAGAKIGGTVGALLGPVGLVAGAGIGLLEEQY